MSNVRLIDPLRIPVGGDAETLVVERAKDAYILETIAERGRKLQAGLKSIFCMFLDIMSTYWQRKRPVR